MIFISLFGVVENREEVKKEIRIWIATSMFFQLLSFLFIIIGVIGEALNKTFWLENMIWFILGIYFTITAAAPLIRSMIAKTMYGIESEKK